MTPCLRINDASSILQAAFGRPWDRLGEPFEGDFRHTDVWTSDDLGRWRLAARHASLAPHG